jgi:hypothetical protein
MEQPVNRASTIGLHALSAIALITVCLGVLTRVIIPGHKLPPEPDEGTLAHIFQLAIGLMAPVGLVFLATTDWTEPRASVRRLAFPTAAVILAFCVLYYLEH